MENFTGALAGGSGVVAGGACDGVVGAAGFGTVLAIDSTGAGFAVVIEVTGDEFEDA